MESSPFASTWPPQSNLTNINATVVALEPDQQFVLLPWVCLACSLLGVLLERSLGLSSAPSALLEICRDYLRQWNLLAPSKADTNPTYDKNADLLNSFQQQPDFQPVQSAVVTARRVGRTCKSAAVAAWERLMLGKAAAARNYSGEPGMGTGRSGSLNTNGVGNSQEIPSNAFNPAAVGGSGQLAMVSEGSGQQQAAGNWYITEQDLEDFKQEAELEGIPSTNTGPPGANLTPMAEGDEGDEDGGGEGNGGFGSWQHVMFKETPGSMKYTAHRRSMPGGRTQYKTVTTVADVTPEEFLDFSLDDLCRQAWEGFLVKVQLLEQGDPAHREQVVRWVRRFPMHFVTDREYVIARRSYIGTDGVVYGVTKGLDFHPDAPLHSKLVRIAQYRSMFCCRPVPSPWGGDRMACETTLLHSENLKVAERLTKMAVKFSMEGFVKKMIHALHAFTRDRRARGVLPGQADPLRYSGSLLHIKAPAIVRARAARTQQLGRATGHHSQLMDLDEDDVGDDIQDRSRGSGNLPGDVAGGGGGAGAGQGLPDYSAGAYSLGAYGGGASSGPKDDGLSCQEHLNFHRRRCHRPRRRAAGATGVRVTTAAPVTSVIRSRRSSSGGGALDLAPAGPVEMSASKGSVTFKGYTSAPSSVGKPDRDELGTQQPTAMTDFVKHVGMLLIGTSTTALMHGVVSGSYKRRT